MKGNNIKRVLFVLSLLSYIFVLYEAKEGVKHCSNAWSFMCSTNYFEELRIWCLLFSPILICCIVYDVYFICGFIMRIGKKKQKISDDKKMLK